MSESDHQLLPFTERVRLIKGAVYPKLQERHSKARRAHKGFAIVSYAEHEILTYRATEGIRDSDERRSSPVHEGL